MNVTQIRAKIRYWDAEDKSKQILGSLTKFGNKSTKKLARLKASLTTILINKHL